MSVKKLAETIILESIVGLWSKKQREESSSFFCGQGFSFWADTAGMTISDRRKILSMIFYSIDKNERLSNKEIFKR
jgi:hypothetical protein